MKNPLNKIYIPAMILGAWRKSYTLACAVVGDKVDIKSKDLRSSKKLDSNMCFSVSKSVTSLALGFLYDEGKVKPSDLICDYLGEFFPENVDKKWYSVTLKDIMHHRTGATEAVDLDWVNAEKWEDKEYLHTLFGYKLTKEIGKEFKYSDGNYYIIARVVEKLTGKDLHTYLNEKLFSPLNFYYHAWAKDGRGHCLGGTGLFLRTEDMAKLGAFWLQKGVYEGKRYLSEDWINQVMDCENDHNYGFGVRREKNGIVTITGMKGQGIFFNLKKKTVFAWHGCKGSILMFLCYFMDRLNII